MKLKRLVCGAVSVAVISASLTVGAASFSDISGHWAESYVKAMVDKGYIKGYDDGTFKPNKTITNTEALILLSRMLGVEDENNKTTVNNAVSAYSSVLSKYTTDYKNEISYLLYRGVIDTSDLDTYISDANKSQSLLRYQCAVLLTKLLGADEEVKNNVFISSSYSDTAQIPSEARPYVEYVRDAKIMEGMGVDSYGDPIFGPNESVTRGQMAKMLSSLIDVLNVKTVKGTVSSVDSFGETVTVMNKAYEIEDGTIVKLDGKDADFGSIKSGMSVTIIIVKDSVSMIEAQSETSSAKSLKGLIVAATTGADGREITISDPEDSSDRYTYEVYEDAKILISGATDTFGKLKSGQYVELTVDADGIVTKVSTLEKSESVVGTIYGKNLEAAVPTVTVENSKGEKTEYELSGNDISITRNGASATILDIVAGDSVTMKLTYGKVTKISAGSETQSSSGSIKSVTHSTSGTTIVVSVNDKTTEYSVGSGATITVDGAEGTVYDLRPGSDIKFKAESTKLTKIETTKAVSSNSVQGTVTSVQTSHNILMVKSGSNEIAVGTTNSTKIISSATGSNVKLSSIATGAEVTVTGSNATGMFIATVIVVH